ncbi:MAG: SHOCT domain-containing protein [Syntrophomonas sp.]
MMRPYWHMGNGGMWTTNWWGFGLELLAWSVIAVLLVWLFTRFQRSQTTSPDAPSALDILKVRYAKGEISKDEFDTMKEHLKQ